MPLNPNIADRAVADLGSYLVKPCPIVGALRCDWGECGGRFGGYEALTATFLAPLRPGVRAIRVFESTKADLAMIDSPRIGKAGKEYWGDITDDLFFQAEAAWKEERFDSLYIIEQKSFTESVLSAIWDPRPFTNPAVFSAAAHRYASSHKLPDHFVAMLLIRDVSYDIPKALLWARRGRMIELYRRFLISCSFTATAFSSFRENYGQTA